MLAYGCISNTTFCAQGYLLGIVFENEELVKLVNGLVVMIFVSSNGVMVNIAEANWFVAGLSYISPSRYNCEGFFRRMIGNVPNAPIVVPYTNTTVPFDSQQLYE